MIDPPEIRYKIGLAATEISAAVEALEQLLIEKGILGPNELMERTLKVAATKVLPGGDG